MIKVALISHSSALCGAEKMLFNLARFLKDSDRYYPVMFLPAFPPYGDLTKACEDEGIQYITLPGVAFYIETHFDSITSVARDTIHYAEDLAQILREQGFDLIINNTLTSLTPALAAKSAGIPMIQWVHGVLDSLQLPAEYGLEQRLLFDRIVMKMSKRVVCCSNWTEDYYRGLCESPICTLWNWSERPEEVLPLDKENRFVCLNTFDPYKGVLVLLKAAVLLKKKGYQFHIDLFGTGFEENNLRQFVTANKLDKLVSFCGRTNCVSDVYNSSFCLVQPSYNESFGLTITEAMSYGRPVIAVSQGGPKDIVADGETGYLLPAGDEKLLAEKMAYLMDHPDKAEEIGAAGKARYDELFSPEHAKESYFQLIEEVLAEEDKPSGETDVLLTDCVWSMLRMLSWLREFYLSLPKPDAPRPVYPESKLCFSGPLTGKRAYNVHCEAGIVSKVGMIFSSHDGDVPRGILTIRLIQRGKEVAVGRVSMEEIRKDIWFDIFLLKPVTVERGYMTVELTFAYDEKCGKLGVYENRDRRGFIYKICNKLHCPLRGKDALIVAFV